MAAKCQRANGRISFSSKKKKSYKSDTKDKKDSD